MSSNKEGGGEGEEGNEGGRDRAREERRLTGDQSEGRLAEKERTANEEGGLRSEGEGGREGGVD